jgi:YD repeat-containing protein
VTLSKDRFFTGDFNGDGLTDILLAITSTVSHGLELRTKLALPSYFNIISEIKNFTGEKIYLYFNILPKISGTILKLTDVVLPDKSICGNGTTEVGYGKVCGKANNSPHRIVTRMIVSDGRNETGWQEDGKDIDLATTYEYHNGRIYPGTIQERADLGFEWVKKIDEQTGAYEITYYRQDKPFHRRPMKSESYAGTRDLLSNTKVRNSADLLMSGTEYEYKIRNPYPGIKMIVTDKTISKTYEMGKLAYTKTKNDVIDKYGYMTKSEDCVRKIGFAIYCVETHFKYSHDESGWKFGRLDEIKQIASATLLKWDKMSYDADGNLKEKQSYFCENTASCNSSSGTWKVVIKDTLYDTWGHAVQTVNAKRQKTTTEYDDIYHAYIKKETNHLNQSSTNILDAFGRIIESVDANGHSSKLTYDEFGRIIRSANAREVWVEKRYMNTGDPNAQYVETRFSQNNEISWNRKYTDGFGFNYKSEALGDDGKIVIVEKKRYYRNNLLVEETSKPRYKGDTALWNKTEYDSAGRPGRTTLAGGSVIEFFRGPTWERTTDANGSSTEYFSIRGKVIRKVDAAGSEIKYEYDPMLRLTKVILPNGQETSITYDSWGRKTSMNDPTTGKTTYQYDLLWNLTSATDAMGRTINYEYDEQPFQGDKYMI